VGHTDDEGEFIPGDWKRIRDRFGEPVTEPVPLKDGLKLPADENPVFLRFRVYREVNYKENLF